MADLQLSQLSHPPTSSKEIAMTSPIKQPTLTIIPTQKLVVTLSNGTLLVLSLALPCYFSPHPSRCRAEDLHLEDDYDETADEYLNNNESCELDPEYDRLYRYISTRTLGVPVSRKKILKNQLATSIKAGFPIPILMEGTQVRNTTFGVGLKNCVIRDIDTSGDNNLEKEYQQRLPQERQQEQKHEYRKPGYEQGLKTSREENWGYYEQVREHQHQHQNQAHPNSYNQIQTKRSSYLKATYISTS